MKIKVSEATPLHLNWMVAKCEGHRVEHDYQYTEDKLFSGWWQCGPNHWQPLCKYSTDWSQGGPLIEKGGVTISLRYASLPPNYVQDVWDAIIKPEFYTSGRPNSGVTKEVIASGPYPLIAAMRCYVASRLGDEVDVPDELV